MALKIFLNIFLFSILFHGCNDVSKNNPVQTDEIQNKLNSFSKFFRENYNPKINNFSLKCSGKQSDNFIKCDLIASGNIWKNDALEADLFKIENIVIKSNLEFIDNKTLEMSVINSINSKMLEFLPSDHKLLYLNTSVLDYVKNYFVLNYSKIIMRFGLSQKNTSDSSQVEMSNIESEILSSIRKDYFNAVTAPVFLAFKNLHEDIVESKYFGKTSFFLDFLDYHNNNWLRREGIVTREQMQLLLLYLNKIGFEYSKDNKNITLTFNNKQKVLIPSEFMVAEEFDFLNYNLSFSEFNKDIFLNLLPAY